jgi:hypothetical protein
MSYRPRIYIHSPLARSLSEERREVRTRMLSLLTTAGFEPQEFGVSGTPMGSAWSFAEAAQLMDTCQGAVIMALPRYEFAGDMLMPSEFAHYEGALALAKSLPTLVLTEERVHNAGIVYRGGGLFINMIPAEIDAFPGHSYLDSEQFQDQFKKWAQDVSLHSRIFFGYCSKAQGTADAIIKYLMKVLGYEVIDWAVDFGVGSEIMTEISAAIRSARCGVFLFTRDDPLEGQPEHAAPRDNVVFETGYCMAARGKRRTIVIREAGAKMPAELGGVIYLSLKDRSDISSIQEKLRQALAQVPYAAS